MGCLSYNFNANLTTRRELLALTIGLQVLSFHQQK